MNTQQILVHELYNRFKWPCSLVVKQAPDKSCSGCSIQSSATIFFIAFLASSVYLAKTARQLIANQSCDGANPSVHFMHTKPWRPSGFQIRRTTFNSLGVRIPVSSNGLGRSLVTGVMRIRIPSLVPFYFELYCGDDPAR